ncbi:MAG: hypothetical protein ACR2FV_02130 [Ornithinimicrobium sp.]
MSSSAPETDVVAAPAAEERAPRSTGLIVTVLALCGTLVSLQQSLTGSG